MAESCTYADAKIHFPCAHLGMNAVGDQVMQPYFDAGEAFAKQAQGRR